MLFARLVVTKKKKRLIARATSRFFFLEAPLSIKSPIAPFLHFHKPSNKPLSII